MSMTYGTRDISPEDKAPVRGPMPPPLVTMSASKLRIRTLQDEIKQKNRIIQTLEAQIRSHIASEDEKARQKEFSKMNRGWRRHNANPNTPWLYRSEGVTEDAQGNIKTEKVIFVTEYKFALERVEKLRAEAGLAEARLQTAYRKTQELIKVAEELEVEVAREKRNRIAKSSPEEDQDTTITDEDATDSDGDVNMRGQSTATAPKRVSLVLTPPKRKRSLSMENIRPARLRLSPPKREMSMSVEEMQSTRLRLSQPKRKDVEEDAVYVEAFGPTHLKLSQHKVEKARSDSHRVRSGRVIKTSAQGRK